MLHRDELIILFCPITAYQIISSSAFYIEKQCSNIALSFLLNHDKALDSSLKVSNVKGPNHQAVAGKL